MRRAAGIFALTLAAGCAGLSVEDCGSADWRAVGRADAGRGASLSDINPQRAFCSKNAPGSTDMSAYIEGREEGLAAYCAPASGFALGARGGDFLDICPESSERGFRDAFRRGDKVYRLDRAAKSADAAASKAESDLWAVKGRIFELESGMASAMLTQEQRNADREELMSLLIEQRRLNQTLKSLNAKLAAAQNAVKARYARGAAKDGAIRPANASF